MSKTFIPSPQQAAILDWTTNGRGSALVQAVAGAGKTTTLIELVKRTTGSVAFVAYNRAIADEIKERIAPLGLGNRVQAGTVHSFGMRALTRAFPNAKLNAKKMAELVDAFKAQGLPEELAGFAADCASMAKQVGIGALPESPFASRETWRRMVEHYDLADGLPEGLENDPTVLNNGLRWACKLLLASNENLGSSFDYDDMVYAPVLKGLRMWQNDWVLLDEAQDTNAVRRALVRMMLRPAGRLVAVGDEAQAIYGFTGADSDSMALIRRQFNACDLPLTVTYRCPQAVVSRVREWVSHIQAHPSAPMGVAGNLSQDQFTALTDLSNQDAILCRNTKPLISLAYSLLRRGIGCRVEGRSIGENLLKLAGRWKKVRTIGTLRNKLESYRELEVAKAIAKGKEERAGQIEDQVDTLLEIMNQFADDERFDVLRPAVEKLFGDTKPGEVPNVLTLATIHRSKGREWRRVFWWGSTVYSPSKYARQEWQVQQEANLCYVAGTRAKEELWEVEVPVAANKWEKVA